METTVIRLLLLIGCRKSEIGNLRWSEYREGKLFLADSKTGPRTVWLCSAARAILDGLPRRGHWVFKTNRTRRPVRAVERVWRRVRLESGVGWNDCQKVPINKQGNPISGPKSWLAVLNKNQSARP